MSCLHIYTPLSRLAVHAQVPERGPAHIEGLIESAPRLRLGVTHWHFVSGSVSHRGTTVTLSS